MLPDKYLCFECQIKAVYQSLADHKSSVSVSFRLVAYCTTTLIVKTQRWVKFLKIKEFGCVTDDGKKITNFGISLIVVKFQKNQKKRLKLTHKLLLVYVCVFFTAVRQQKDTYCQ